MNKKWFLFCAAQIAVGSLVFTEQQRIGASMGVYSLGFIVHEVNIKTKE